MRYDNLVSDDDNKKLLIEMMVSIDAFCRNNNIKYYLAGGTLLGAVRHKGFIPWDDDIDIAMLRDDYERFIRTFSSERYKVINCDNKKYYLPYAKVYDDSTVLIENVDKAIPIGTYIDVFPLDNCGNSFKEAYLFSKKSAFFRNVLTVKNYNMKNVDLFHKVAACCMKILVVFFPRHYVTQKINRLSASKSGIRMNFVGELTNNVYGEREIYESAIFEKTIELDFEKHKFLCPIGYDSFLRTTYGDYMKLPPVEKRVTHHGYTVWWKD